MRDWAIVLGCRPSSPLLAHRCARAVRLVREGHARRLLLTGTADEADAMVGLVGDAAFAVDDAARRTADNVRHAAAVVGSAPCWLVTSAFHLPRALFLARAAGLDPSGVAAEGPPVTTTTKLRELASWPFAVVDAVRLRG